MFIVTHMKPAHIDDFIGCALACSKFKTGEIVRVPPQGIPADLLADTDAVFIDVGRTLDPSRLRLDHHHDSNVPCAAHLAVQVLYPELASVLDTKALTFLDVKDRLGPIAACRSGGGGSGSKSSAALESKLTCIDPSPAVGEAVLAVLNQVKPDWTYNQLIVALWAAMPEDIQQAAKAEYQQRMDAYASITERAVYREVKGMRMAYLDMPIGQLGEAFKRTSADLIVAPNPMDPRHTALVRRMGTERRIRFDRAAHDAGRNEVFLHNNGFIVVLEGRMDVAEAAAVAARCIH